LEPANSKLWNNKGMALTDMGKYCEALKCLNKSLLLDPSNAKAGYNKGVVLSKLGRRAEADECFKKSGL
jgi:tetratricopeptide (TPR) repeat protein